MKRVFPVLGVAAIMMVLIIALVHEDVNRGTGQSTVEVKARILEVDNGNVVQAGISSIGTQSLIIEITEGEFKGQKTAATNNLIGKLELDNYFEPGDRIVAALLVKGANIEGAKTIDLYRQDWQFVLFILFVLCLILYAGFVGLKALLSFMASLFLIWKVLIPGLLDGQNPMLLTVVIVALLSAIIIFLVAGFTRKGIAAFAGTVCGLIVSVGLTVFFGGKLALTGMTQAFAETLLFNGHLDLNMRFIFYAAIIIGASGAAMDIAMDVAASMEEIKIKKPDITMSELIKSGISVGKAVIGTMTTTLLLAYSGGYLTLLMLFMTKNSSFARIINLQIVSAEIMRTVVGSIGLVLVAPFTAVFAGWIYTGYIGSLTGKTDEAKCEENA